MAGEHRLEDGHAHGGHGHDAELAVSPVWRWSIVGTLALVALVTVIGIVHWWPDSSAVDQVRGSIPYAVQGSTFEKARITEVSPTCDYEQVVEGTACGTISGMVIDGEHEGEAVTLEVQSPIVQSGAGPGDVMILLRTPDVDGYPGTVSFFEFERKAPLVWFAIAFLVLVVAVIRLRGLMSMVSLAVAGLVLYLFTLPAILAAEPVVPIAAVSAVAIMFVVLYATHGVSMRTSVALAGTVLGVVITVAAAHLAMQESLLTGFVGEDAGLISQVVRGVGLQDILVASAVFVGLGALNDVTITQASAVSELRAASPSMSRLELFRSAMRIGRDHVASTIYTLAFAYVGSALLLLLAIQLYDTSAMGFVSMEEIAEEIVRSLVGGVGLVLAMPVTTALAVAASGASAAAERPGGEDI